MTISTMLILELLTRADPDDPPWGYRLCEGAGLGSGTVYPILERLERAGWIEGRWETGTPVDRPRRRLYRITTTGREQYASALARRGSAAPRWLPGWLRPREEQT
jgi:PadR family transcriptional regulator PadR